MHPVLIKLFERKIICNKIKITKNFLLIFKNNSLILFLYKNSKNKGKNRIATGLIEIANIKINNDEIKDLDYVNLLNDIHLKLGKSAPKISIFFNKKYKNEHV